MRSRSSACLRALAIALVLALSAPCFAQEQEADGSEPTQAEIAAALDKLRADPNLAHERKTRTPRWLSEEDEEAKEPSSFMEWVKDFFVWLGQLSRALVWVLGGLLALGLLWFLVALIKGVGATSKTATEPLPTHVRDLDIRPESLPENIGTAALALWNRGEHRAALALLYRGLLSRLVHVHDVPIRDSSTEGDCLALASKHLSAQRSAFVTTLIRTWQRATYGAHDPQTEAMQALCAGFDAALAPDARGRPT